MLFGHVLDLVRVLRVEEDVREQWGTRRWTLCWEAAVVVVSGGRIDDTLPMTITKVKIAMNKGD